MNCPSIFNPEVVFEQIQKAMDNGEIKQMDPRHLIVNIISMCVFPFAARPILNHLIFRENKEALEKFYTERAAVVKQFVIDAIEIKK